MSNISKKIDNHIRSLSPALNTKKIQAVELLPKIQSSSNLNEKYTELLTLESNLYSNRESKNKNRSSIPISDHQIMKFGAVQNNTLGGELVQINHNYKSSNAGYISENVSNPISEDRSNSRDILRSDREIIYKKNSHDLSNRALNKIKELSIIDVTGEQNCLRTSQIKNFNRRSSNLKTEIPNNILPIEAFNNVVSPTNSIKSPKSAAHHLKNQLSTASKSKGVQSITSFNENEPKSTIRKVSEFNDLDASATNNIINEFSQPNKNNIPIVTPGSQNQYQLNSSRDNNEMMNENQLTNNNSIINENYDISNKSQGRFYIFLSTNKLKENKNKSTETAGRGSSSQKRKPLNLNDSSKLFKRLLK